MEDPVSYDLAVLAMDASADTAAAQAMFARCNTLNHHPDGQRGVKAALSVAREWALACVP
jgi:hypothetical protein